jgi:DNA-binding CsgD family transcriptional regulator
MTPRAPNRPTPSWPVVRGPATVAILAASDRPADQLASRLAALPGVGSVFVEEASGGPGDDLPAPAVPFRDLSVVRLGPLECLAAFERFPDLVRHGPVLAIGPAILSTRALQLGAIAYLTTREIEEELPAAVAAAIEGHRYLGASVVEGFVASGLAAAAAVSRLSARELEVVIHAGRDESPGRTAAAIGVAPEAVTRYRIRARMKLGLETTDDLVSFAIAHGLR